MRQPKQEAKRRTYDALYAALDPRSVNGLYDTIVKRIFTSHLANGDRVADLGAFHGRQTLLMAAAVGPLGRVFAFEPLDTAFATLCQQIERHGLQSVIEPRQVALMDRHAEVDFYLVNEAPGRSGLVWTGSPSEKAGSFTATRMRVQGTQLDDALQASGPLRLLHLDLEGAELTALRGATDLLMRHRPLLVFRNSRAAAAAMHHYTAEEFCGFFDAAGYEIFNILSFRFQAQDWTTGRQPSWYIGIPAEDETSKGSLHGMIDDVIGQKALSSIFD
ncbi:FkbM family methyltransferase [Roseomonas marmotae]|uniref:FkbM family methyltransferase n=1 Tax=Roseomonas marmotae TaxID=2768161 RepID=A0ABS3KEE1_9PROT|nr:FkbM family methyltransferase [Roseomonas marmotae]MBO1075810.1 FkbM family methyltransferase [Roseomonas marmotae]QTI80532.1 FkbM family methyltransferase [Roseomonas marmotae]